MNSHQQWQLPNSSHLSLAYSFMQNYLQGKFSIHPSLDPTRLNGHRRDCLTVHHDSAM
jgi:hypothetical protein